MVLIGKKVNHIKFGDGIIIAQDKEYLTVAFSDYALHKKFQYPMCFKSFLKILDSKAELEVNAAVYQSEMKEQEKREKEYQQIQAKILMNQMEKKTKASGPIINMREFSSVRAFGDKYTDALLEEIKYLKANGGKRYKVFEGKRVLKLSYGYIYIFETDRELNLPEETQIHIWRGKESISGIIIGYEDFTIILLSKADLGDKIASIEFSAEPWRLLAALCERLDEIKCFSSKIVQSLVCDGLKQIDSKNLTIVTGQKNALEMSIFQPVTFIWGPPGTGKTQTLARIALEHMKRGNRVLMLSYSNVSVDGAILRIANLHPEFSAGELLRYGYARQKEVTNHPYLTSFNFVIRNHPELVQEQRNLIKEKGKFKKEDPRYIEILMKIERIKRILKYEEKVAVKNAEFVATTVSKAIVDKTIQNTRFDVVIFDEASMAYVPQIVFGASLARKRFICLGDFNQLPPIVQCNSASILNIDIFQYTGISSAVGTGKNHKWLCMLNTQYRMHPDISDFSSRNMYRNLLKSEDNMDQLRKPIVDSFPIKGNALTFADLSGMLSVCLKSADGSRFNILSALISFGLAMRAAEKHDTAIITPYIAQSRLLYAMARDAMKCMPDQHPISCATVHQFQGSEKDVVIYDAVDCYRMTHPGILLTSKVNDYANRLFNVALTRAKGKFIGVANVAYLENKNLSKNLMFERLIQKNKLSNGYRTAMGLLDELMLLNNEMLKYYTQIDGITKFIADLKEAKVEIRIDIPNSPKDDDSIDLILSAITAAKTRGVSVYIRVESKINLQRNLRTIAIENAYISNPIVLIDKKIVWYGVPLSDAKFRSEGRILPTRIYPIIRIVGTHIAKSLYSYLEMEKTSDQSKVVMHNDDGTLEIHNFSSYVLENKKCPSCGRPMKVQKSRREKFFLACTGYPQCREIAYIESDLVQRYFYRNSRTGQKCIQCGCPLEAKVGPYGLYIQCCGHPSHRYKIDEI